MTGVTVEPYVASRAHLGLRLYAPAVAGMVQAPVGLKLADTHATLTVLDDHAVEQWADYLRDQGARIVDEPHAAGTDYRAVVVWDGWQVTIVCTDPAAPHHAALRRAVDAGRAARGEAVA